jgi:hypothetical protein
VGGGVVIPLDTEMTGGVVTGGVSTAWISQDVVATGGLSVVGTSHAVRIGRRAIIVRRPATATIVAPRFRRLRTT